MQDTGLHINNTNHILYTLTGSLLFLTSGFLVLSFLCPFATDNSYATTERTTNGDYYIETTTTDLNLSINTTPAGAQETASHDVIVKTDDPAGFTLTVSVNNDTSNALNLNGSTSATEKFAATSGTYTSPAALDDNAWGFADTLTKKNNDQWAAVPLLKNAQQIKQTSSATPSGDTTTVHYGIKAKYDGKHSNGNYANTIVYSVTGNTIPKNPITDNMYMQDVTQEMCTDTTLYSASNSSYSLKDSRDNRTYLVRKLEDGNCWMVSNLNLQGGTRVEPSKSDVSTAYTLPSSSSAGFRVADTAYVYNDNTLGVSYYTWRAATANTGTSSITSSNAASSICPKRWKLPSSSGEHSWYGLYSSYGGNASAFQTNTLTSSGWWLGYYYNSSLKNSGLSGEWWSRTATATSGYAYTLLTNKVNNISRVDPQRLDSETNGYNVRCVFVGA